MALGYMFKKDTVIYINTILPIGAAIGGRLTGKRVIYHYHENAKAKSTFYRILAKLMQLIANDIICVSEYQRKFIRRKKRVHVIPNALERKFTDNIVPDTENAFRQKRVLMLGSLKGYKGTKEFIELASRMKEYNFELIINDSEDNIRSYIKRNSIDIPENITVHPRQNDVVEFYNRATVVLNLSNRKLAIETFGLTALEAMTAGLPVIVPTVGGIAEMVNDGINGYKIDVQEKEKIEKKIEEILTDK
jgi:glycosyltransferase involved in cell wall biosynthesis